MKKLLFLIFLLPAISYSQSYYEINERAQYETTEKIKTPGNQLKAAGTAFYISTGLAFASAGAIYLGNKRYDDKIHYYPLSDHSEILTNAKYLSGILGGASFISMMVAYGKLIKAGSLLEQETLKTGKTTSFNFTGNGISLVYRF